MFLLAGLALGQDAQEEAKRLLISLYCPPAKAHPSFCVSPDEEKRIALALVSLGTDAIPVLEEKLKRWEQLLVGRENPTVRGRYSLDFTPTPILYAYGRLLGPAAIPRLRQAGLRQKFDGAVMMDRAIASAVALSSYVSSDRRYEGPPGHTQDPRATLDSLILAWQLGRMDGVSPLLTASANEALTELRSEEAWRLFWRDAWRGSEGVVAVGYQFQNVGLWSVPFGFWNEGFDWSGAMDLWSGTAKPKRAETLLARFTDSEGNDCGEREITFAWNSTEEGSKAYYRVDGADVGGLLRLIAFCGSPK